MEGIPQFLKPSRGVVTIERTFRQVSVLDERWGYYVVARLGRVECLHSRFTIKITAKIIKVCRYVRID